MSSEETGVSAARNPKSPVATSQVWPVLPLVLFAFITLTVGLVATATVREPYATSFFHPFFSDVLQMKAWLVTAVVVLACGQLLTAARIYELLGFPPKGRFYHVVHRWSGRAAIVLTLPVAYHCIFLLGFSRQQSARPDSLTAGVGALRRRGCQGARRPIEQVPGLGTSRRRSSPVLHSSRAMADVGTRVLCRWCPCQVTEGSLRIPSLLFVVRLLTRNAPEMAWTDPR
jgi:hypothetical protein